MFHKCNHILRFTHVFEENSNELISILELHYTQKIVALQIKLFMLYIHCN